MGAVLDGVPQFSSVQQIVLVSSPGWDVLNRGVSEKFRTKFKSYKYPGKHGNSKVNRKYS